MVPYIILMFAPLLFYQVAVIRRKNEAGKTWSVSIGKSPEQLNNSLIVPVFFLLLFLLLAMRHETLGRDLVNYQTYFDQFRLGTLKTALESPGDNLYWLLNWVVGQFTDSFQVFLVVVAAITVLPIAMIYSDDRQYGFLKIVLFMNMSIFVMLFSGLRQSIAISIGVIAYYFVRKKKPFWFLVFALIAWGFHHTGFMVLLYYPLYHLRLKKHHLWFVIPIITAVFVFNQQLFTWMTSVAYSVMGEKYDMEVQETGAYLMIVLFVLFAVAAYFFPDEEKMDTETLSLRNFLLMAVLLQCFAPVHELSMRMNYYFILFVPIVVPKIFKYTRDNVKGVAKLARVVIVVFFVVYYLYTTYEKCKTGISDLDTFPYKFFWEC